MNLFKRHITSTFFLGLYLVWWILFIYWFKSGYGASPRSCGAANGALVMLSILIIVFYTLLLIIKFLITRGEGRWDYLKFIGLVHLPAIIMTICVAIFSTKVN